MKVNMRSVRCMFIYLGFYCISISSSPRKQHRLISLACAEPYELNGQESELQVDASESVKMCKDKCIAQWKTDFNVTLSNSESKLCNELVFAVKMPGDKVYFQKNFDKEFYEFPLDATITSSRKDFLAFCRMTMQKILCFKRECGVHRRKVPWSTDVHLCLYRKRLFLSSLKCFNRTAEGAHHTCNRYCTKLSNHYRLRPDEEKYLASLDLSRHENTTYIDMTVKCYFQVCQYECRRGLMKHHCTNEHKTKAIEALFDYYVHDQLDQYQSFANQNHQKMLPLMCRTLLPHRYQINNIASESVKRETELLKRGTKNKTIRRSTAA